MLETAYQLTDTIENKTIVLTGAMIPFKFGLTFFTLMVSYIAMYFVDMAIKYSSCGKYFFTLVTVKHYLIYF